MPGNETHEQSVHELEETNEYWTNERMRDAQPAESPPIPPDELRRMIEEGAPPEPFGEGVTIPSGEPEGMVTGEPHRGNRDERPYWNCGAIFFTGPDGKDYRGSGAFCGSNRTVLTAAHCVRSGKGVWFTNVVFYRAYAGRWWGADGQRVGIHRMCVRSEWVNGSSGDSAFDYAFCYTSDASGAGWLGLRTEIPYSSWTSVGYPRNYEEGTEVYAVSGDKGMVFPGRVQMLGNPFEGGSSGGPWIGDFSSTYRPYTNMAIGVNAESQPGGKMWGPYFDQRTFELFEHAARSPSG